MRAAYRIGLLGFLAVVLAGPATATEEGCRACSQERRACRLEGRLQLVECVTHCPTAPADREERRECRRACAEAWKGVRADCSAQCELCRPDCEAVDPSCREACADDLRDCLRGENGVKNVFAACREECRETQMGAVSECRAIEPPRNRWECFVGKGKALGECLRGCAEEAIPGVQACTAGLKSCLSVCAEPQPAP